MNIYDYLDKNIEKLPNSLKISTITLICKFNTKFNCYNINKYIKRDNVFLEVGYKKKSFYNQTTLKINLNNKMCVNAKIFNNGTIQITGCKDKITIIKTLKIIINKFKIKNIKGKTLQDNIYKIYLPFCNNIDELDIKKIISFNFVMVNSVFKLPFKIEREKVYKLLVKENYVCSFEPLNHPSINLKLNYNGDYTTLLIFESGNIIICGARDFNQVIQSYNFINLFLLGNIMKIIKIDITNNITYKIIQNIN